MPQQLLRPVSGFYRLVLGNPGLGPPFQPAHALAGFGTQRARQSTGCMARLLTIWRCQYQPLALIPGLGMSQLQRRQGSSIRMHRLDNVGLHIIKTGPYVHDLCLQLRQP